MNLHRLEPRRLLSAVYDPSTRLLSVNGTPAADTIVVEVDADPGGAATELRATVNGVTTTWNGTDALPARIIIAAGAGDDTLLGQDGDDTLQGDGGADTLLGGRGLDTVTFAYASPARASIADGPDDGPVNDPSDRDDVRAGTETLMGGNGDDTLVGDDADNLLRGNVFDVGGAFDHLFGRGGDDRLEGGTLLVGGRGNDTLYGGWARDLLLGGSGNDLVDGGTARDTVRGGAGHDTHNEGQFDSLDQPVVMTGTLRRENFFATTMFVLRPSLGSTDLIFLDVSADAERALSLLGQRVSVLGAFVRRDVPDLGEQRVLTAESIQPV